VTQENTVVSRRSLWALAAVAFLLYIAGNSHTPLMDRDEPRFAQAAREMLRSGDFIVPHFNGEVRFDKPVLAYYFIAAGMGVFGPNEVGARVASALFGALSVFVVFFLARRVLASEAKALLAAAFLASAPVMVVESKQCTVDALLLLLVLLSFTGLWRIYEGPCENKWKALFWASLALGALTKGPVAVAVAFGCVFLLVAISRDRSFLGRMAWPWGIPLFILIVAPWVLAVQERTAGEFLRVALGKHVIQRASEPLESHRGFPGYYVLTFFVTMFPWAFFAPAALWNAVRGLRDKKKEIFLVAWAGGLVIILEIVETKMVHYSLPVFPAMAILVADYLVGALQSHDRRVISAIASAMVLAVIMALGLPVFAFLYGMSAAVEPLAAAGVVLLAGMSWWLVVARKWGPLSIGAGVAAVFAWLFVMASWAVPALLSGNPSKEAASLVAQARESLGSYATVALYEGYKEPSLVFYCDGALFPPAPRDLNELHAPGAPDILVFSTKNRGMVELLQASDFRYVGSASGLNFAYGKPVRLSVWSRPPARTE